MDPSDDDYEMLTTWVNYNKMIKIYMDYEILTIRYDILTVKH